MKKFLLSMTLALCAMCMPCQASETELASPAVTHIKEAAPSDVAESANGVVVVIKDGSVIIVVS